MLCIQNPIKNDLACVIRIYLIYCPWNLEKPVFNYVPAQAQSFIYGVE